MNTQTISRGILAGTALAAALLVLTSFANFTDAHSEGTVASSTATSTKPMKGAKNNVNATCMGEAVSDREEALMDAWEAMSSSTLAALDDRKDALHTAWEKTDLKARNLAVIKAWQAWRTDKKEITMEFRKDRKAAWDAFKKTAKTECKMNTTPKDENLEKATSDAIAI